MKAVLVLANAVQHDQAATLRDAALTAEATDAIINIVAIIAGRRERPLGAIREELAERLARIEAEAASWKEKYEAAVGFSASATLDGYGVPGAHYVRVQASQDVQTVAVDYCLGDGAHIVTDNTPGALRGNQRVGLDGRDVRVPINYSYLREVFDRATGGGGAGRETITMMLRVRLRAGDSLHEKELKVRVVHEPGSSEVRIG